MTVVLPVASGAVQFAVAIQPGELGYAVSDTDAWNHVNYWRRIGIVLLPVWIPTGAVQTGENNLR